MLKALEEVIGLLTTEQLAALKAELRRRGQIIPVKDFSELLKGNVRAHALLSSREFLENAWEALGVNKNEAIRQELGERLINC